MFTSIFRPSTTVPFSCSLALSASAAEANVTKPKPFEPLSLKIISTSKIGPYFCSKEKKLISLNQLNLKVIILIMLNHENTKNELEIVLRQKKRESEK